ncbi:NAD(P)-binding protein, partial [Coemansia reversa NRRL 1564]
DNKYVVRDKVALITGALGAIGKATCFQLAKLGASLILVDILPDSAGNGFCRELIQTINNASAVYIQADLRNSRDIQRMLTEGTEVYSHIDILINNAGIALYNDYYHDEKRDLIDMAIDINLKAPLEATRLFARELKNQGREGVVVNLSSITALVPGRFVEIYGATKVALMYFTKASAYMAPQIRIAAVAP